MCSKNLAELAADTEEEQKYIFQRWSHTISSTDGQNAKFSGGHKSFTLKVKR
jgi:hypothetical protein